MIAVDYFILMSISIFALGISGILASRHFLIMMFSVEIALTASTLLAVSLFYFTQAPGTIILLLAIWSAATVEVLAIIVFYRYMTAKGVDLDLLKLSKLRNR